MVQLFSGNVDEPVVAALEQLRLWGRTTGNDIEFGVPWVDLKTLEHKLLRHQFRAANCCHSGGFMLRHGQWIKGPLERTPVQGFGGLGLSVHLHGLISGMNEVSALLSHCSYQVQIPALEMRGPLLLRCFETSTQVEECSILEALMACAQPIFPSLDSPTGTRRRSISGQFWRSAACSPCIARTSGTRLLARSRKPLRN